MTVMVATIDPHNSLNKWISPRRPLGAEYRVVVVQKIFWRFIKWENVPHLLRGPGDRWVFRYANINRH